MSDTIKQLNRVFLDGNNNIVIQDVDNTQITINQNNPEEFKQFLDSFGSRVAEIEEILLGQQGSYSDLKQLLSEHIVPLPKSVMVVGTGAYELPEAVLECSRQIGKKIAQMGYNLIVGGWEGVDYTVAEEYSKAIAQQNLRLSTKMTQVVERGRNPIFEGGNVVTVERGTMEWIEGLKLAQLLIIIGGEGGSFETFIYARQELVPVVPVGFTGGDALRVYEKILSDMTFYPKLKKNSKSFELLNSPNYLQGVQELLKGILG